MSDNAKEKLLLGPHAFGFDKTSFPYKDLWNHIEDIHQNRQFYEDNKIYSTTNVITILGERGSGKTSLLLSLKNYLENPPENERKNIKFNIHVLENPIDPSFVVDSNNIVKLILSLLFSSYINIINNQKDKEIDREIIGQFAEINKTVNRLTNIEEGNDSLDDLLLTKSVFELKNSINELVKKYLNAIGKDEKDYLMIMIDDIDLNTKSCYEMLEQIRKYLCQTNIIIILSGNYNDFSDTVHNEYVKQFSNILIKGFNEEEFEEKMKNKTKNYLIKVLPIPYQIDLSNRSYLLGNNYINEIFDILSDYNFFIPIDGDKILDELKEIVNLITGTSLRFKVQLLYQLDRIKNNISKENEEKIKERKNMIYESLIYHIQKVNNQFLKYEKVNIDKLTYDKITFNSPDKVNNKENKIKNICNCISFIFDADESIDKNFENFNTDNNALFHYYKNIKENHKEIEEILINKQLSDNSNIYPWDIIPHTEENSKNIFVCIYMLTLINDFYQSNISKTDYIENIYLLLKSYGLEQTGNKIKKLMIVCKPEDLTGIFRSPHNFENEELDSLKAYLLKCKKNYTPKIDVVIGYLKQEYKLTDPNLTAIIARNNLISDRKNTDQSYTKIKETRDKEKNDEYRKSYRRIIDAFIKWYEIDA